MREVKEGDGTEDLAERSVAEVLGADYLLMELVKTREGEIRIFFLEIAEDEATLFYPCTDRQAFKDRTEDRFFGDIFGSKGNRVVGKSFSAEADKIRCQSQNHFLEIKPALIPFHR